MCNVDETGVMANLVSIKVMGDLSKRKQERILMIVGTQFQLLESAKQQVPVVHGYFLHLARE
jgi:hypothetical protein